MPRADTYVHGSIGELTTPVPFVMNIFVDEASSVKNYV